MPFSSVIKKLSVKKLFLLDSLGAMATAILVGLVLPAFQSFFGVSVAVLHLLAIVAICFCVYSFLCYLMVKQYFRPFLYAIALANALYCVLTLLLLSHDSDVVTAFGWVYFVGELLIVLTLALTECKKAAE